MSRPPGLVARRAGGGRWPGGSRSPAPAWGSSTPKVGLHLVLVHSSCPTSQSDTVSHPECAAALHTGIDTSTSTSTSNSKTPAPK